MGMFPSRFERALNIEDLRRLAARRLPAFALAYLESGADDHVSLHWNRRVFDQWRFVPDTLRDVEQRDLSTDILGARAQLPLIVAPTGFNGMLCHQADILLARAARSAGMPFTLSTMSSVSIEDVAREAAGTRLWFQLYMLKDREITLDLLRRAEAAGYEALVFTTDCAHFGNRESERRFFRAPMKLTVPAMFDAAWHPRWFFEVIAQGRGVPGFGNLARYFSEADQASGRGASFIVSRLDQSINWNDLAFLRAHWRGKLLVKGVLHPQDALQAVRLGADGVVLTNHGGRQLDACVSPMEVVEAVRAACGPASAVIIDSGFRRGTDVAKALALGADAVMIGRPLLYGAAAAGQAGIDRAVTIIVSEFERTLGQLGVKSPAELARRHLTPVGVG